MTCFSIIICKVILSLYKILLYSFQKLLLNKIFIPQKTTSITSVGNETISMSKSIKEIKRYFYVPHQSRIISIDIIDTNLDTLKACCQA